jgi:hypothetical protein
MVEIYLCQPSPIRAGPVHPVASARSNLICVLSQNVAIND